MKKFWLILLLVCGVRLLSSCGGGGGNPQLAATHFSVIAQGNAVAGQL